MTPERGQSDRASPHEQWCPGGAWSALYVERIDDKGFYLKSGAGEKDVEFHWMAVAKAMGYQERPQITIPDPVADEAVAREKAEAIAAQWSSPASRQSASGTTRLER